MQIKKKFFINGIIMTFTTLVLRSVILFFNSYISQKIGAEALGLYGLIMSVYSFAVTIALSGINLAITKVISEEIAIGNVHSSHIIVKKGLVLSFLFGVSASLILILISPFITSSFLHNKITYKPFYIISFSLPFISMSSCIMRILFCYKKYHQTR